MSLKVEFKEKSKKVKPTIKVTDIPIGTLFTCGLWRSFSDVFLRTFEGIVLLNDPSNTWDANDMEIGDYQPVNGVLIITGQSKK